MSLPKEILEALDSGSVEAEDYRAEQAWEGYLLYKNLIDTPAYRKKFFPYSKAQDPVIAEPIPSSIINRLTSALRKGTTYSATINGVDATEELHAIIKQTHWEDITLDALTKTLATGSQLFWLGVDDLSKVSINTIQPYYSGKIFNEAQRLQGYYQAYSTDTRTMLDPIDIFTGNEAQSVVKYVDETVYIKWINGARVIYQAHNLPFIPAVWADNIDYDEDGTYGVPYVNRFKTMLMHLNATLSQKQKSLIFLQNIWIAKTDLADSKDGELVLTPDIINYVGPDGDLSQAVRNLDLTEETNQINYLKRAIYKAAQVPMDDDLSTQGKVESGVALRILYAQLEEVIGRLRHMWSCTEEDVLTKAFRMQRLADGRTDPKDSLHVEVVYDTEIVPEDLQHKLDIELRLLENGLIRKETLIRKYNKASEDIDYLLSQSEAPANVVQSTPPENGAI